VTPKILRFDSIDSTNLEAIRQAKAGASEGLCVVAREQTHGRGRLDRRWHSPKDAGLYFSILLRPPFDVAKWPLIGLASALAVSDAIIKTSGLAVDIKWPNDICFKDQKLCGILAETVETPTGTAAIVGVGINLLAESIPPELHGRATSIESVRGERIDHNLLIDAIVNALGERYQMLHNDDGREHTLREWCANSSYAFGRSVRVAIGDEGFTGVTRGLESDGALRVEMADGNVRIVRAGDVTALRSLMPE
jgi:BirA family transcriptional regulator, biotin operon repressor / biotin---[acetyl-CoA-carboxylase] ligase